MASPDAALSHQPFLLVTTYLTVRLGFNKVNGLASRQCAERDPLVAGCDNALGLVSQRNQRLAVLVQNDKSPAIILRLHGAEPAIFVRHFASTAIRGLNGIAKLAFDNLTITAL
jgi:hypothetical protein